MATSLNSIISAIKTVALANGFVSVEELKLNLNNVPDTQLPRLFIKLNGLTYSKYLVDTAQEDYRLELILILADSANPVSDLKAKIDLLLNKLATTNNLFGMLTKAGKVELVETDLTNDRDLYSRFGGEGATLKINIKNINNFGGNPCQ